MSMLRYMRDRKFEIEAWLFYANHTEDDIVFRQELDNMLEIGYPKLKIVHVLDHPGTEWSGETGFVDDAKLSKYLDSFEDKAFYVCCPPAMRQSVLQILKKRGVKSNQIRVEIFSL